MQKAFFEAAKKRAMGSTVCTNGGRQSVVVPVDANVSMNNNKLSATATTSKRSRPRRQDSRVHPQDLSQNTWESSSLSKKLDNSIDIKENSTLFSSFRSRHSVQIFRRPSDTHLNETFVTTSRDTRPVSLNIDSQLLQKYMVHSVIGKGSFSTVLLIENKITKTKCALKTIEKKRSFRTNVPWERELEILKKVHHPNIVHLLETHATTSKVYFVLELATGGDLYQRLISVGHFPEHQAKQLLYQILDVLQYLHKHGVTHRDLKLENCLFKTPELESSILLSDFGLAHLRPEDEQSEGMQTTCGTPEYISPEMLEGEIYTDLVDMWAYGIIVYAVLSGSMPFQDDSKAKMFKKIREGQYTFTGEIWTDISYDAKDFISQLLCIDVKNRLSAKSAMKHIWIIQSHQTDDLITLD